MSNKNIKISTFLLLSITLAPCLPRFWAIASLGGVTSVLSLSNHPMYNVCFCAIFCCYPNLPNAFSGGCHNSNLCSDFLKQKMTVAMTMKLMRMTWIFDNNENGIDNNEKNPRKHLSRQLPCRLCHRLRCGEASLRRIVIVIIRFRRLWAFWSEDDDDDEVDNLGSHRSQLPLTCKHYLTFFSFLQIKI